MIKNPKKSNDEEIKDKQTPETEACEEETSTCEAGGESEETASEENIEAPEGNKELEELNDKYLRLMAEYDNFKKRTVKEKEAIYIDSVAGTVEQLLPVLDNFERALASFSEEDKSSEFYKGFEMIYNQTNDIFTKLGVKVIEALGEEFNPEFHNAVMHVEDENADDNIIVEEFQKGYTYRDKVIRYSMVKVAN